MSISFLTISFGFSYLLRFTFKVMAYMSIKFSYTFLWFVFFLLRFTFKVMALAIRRGFKRLTYSKHSQVLHILALSLGQVTVSE